MNARVPLISTLTLILGVALIAGCGKSTAPMAPTGSTGTSGMDQAQISGTLAATP